MSKAAFTNYPPQSVSLRRSEPAQLILVDSIVYRTTGSHLKGGQQTSRKAKESFLLEEMSVSPPFLGTLPLEKSLHGFQVMTAHILFSG